MLKAPIPQNEEERLKRLKDYLILDTQAEKIFDDLVQTAASICESPIALISLIDSDRQWFKSKVGLDVPETPRDVSFCGHAIAQESGDPFIVEDAFKDVRFADNPLVCGFPNVRFYAGFPLRTPEGLSIGTLCVIDTENKSLTKNQILAMESLSRQVINYLELKEKNTQLANIKQELDLQNNHFLRVIDNMLEGLVVQDSDGKIINYNQSALNILGLTADQLNGKDSMDPSWQSIREDGTDFPGEEHPAMIALKTGCDVKNVVMGVRTKNIEVCWIKINSTVLKTQNGLNSITTFVDITESKKAHEKKLKELNEIISSTPSCLKIIDSKGRLLEMNRQGLDLIEADTFESVLHANVYDLVTHAHKKKFIELNEKVCKGGKGHLEFEIVGLKGAQRWMETYAAPYVLSSGEVCQIAITNDITDRIKNKEETEYILHNMSVGTWKWDIKKDLFEWNDSNYKVFQISKNETQSPYQTWLSMLHPDSKEKAVQDFQNAIKNGIEFNTGFKIILKNGEMRFIGSKADVFRDENGNPERMLGIFWDKTDEFLASEELEKQVKISQHQSKLASIGELASGIGHEINNPLAIIKGHLLALEEKLKDQGNLEVRNVIDKMDMALTRIANIVQGLRTFSRIDSDKTTYFSIISSLEESLNMVQEIYQRDGLIIEYVNKLPKEYYLKGNRGQLQQVFINLLSNAKDSLENKGNKKIKIELSVNQDKLVILFEDNGDGIKDNVIDKIFDPFFTTKEVGKGTGIGLSLSYNFIKALGGTISAENAPSGGAVFAVIIPAQDQHTSIENLKTAIEKEKATDKQQESKSVLIVDDEPEILDILSYALKDLGWIVETANDGIIALEKLSSQKESFDLVISDMKMPNLGGEDLLKKIRSNNNLKKQPRFLFMTGGVNKDLQQKINKKEFDGYLFKPFNLNQLIDLINSLD